MDAKNFNNIPKLYSQEKVSDPLVHVRFFTESGCEWLATEFDGEDIFFGWCDLNQGFPELGYFSLEDFKEGNEISEGTNNPFYMFRTLIKIDKSFQPVKLSEAKQRKQNGF